MPDEWNRPGPSGAPRPGRARHRAALNAGRRRAGRLRELLCCGVVDSFGLSLGWTLFNLVATARGGLALAALFNAAMLLGVVLSAPVTGWLARHLHGRTLLTRAGVTEAALRVATLGALLAGVDTRLVAAGVVAMHVAAYAGFAAMRAEVAAVDARPRAMTRYALSIAAVEAAGAGVAALLPMHRAALAVVFAVYGLSLVPTLLTARRARVYSTPRNTPRAFPVDRRHPNTPGVGLGAHGRPMTECSANPSMAASSNGTSAEGNWSMSDGTAMLGGGRVTRVDRRRAEAAAGQSAAGEIRAGSDAAGEVRAGEARAGRGAAKETAAREAAGVRLPISVLVAGGGIMLLSAGPTLLSVALATELHGRHAVAGAAAAFSAGCLLSSWAVDRVGRLRLPTAVAWPLWGVGMLVGWLVAPTHVAGLFLAQFLSGLSMTAFEGGMDARLARQVRAGSVTTVLAWSASTRALGGAIAVRTLPALVTAPAIGAVAGVAAGLLSAASLVALVRSRRGGVPAGSSGEVA
ncbi:hypothetical protein [Dactylosporangium sp. CA-092794]|uniref:hypothetical protein n=1 Tax=Dactylosporangium sp. CA-092794 TaxID=3239929 RepID=UPI003D9113A6